MPFSVERAAFAQSVAVPPDIIGGEHLRGRGRVVQELLESFEGAGDGGRSLLLHGLGGSGKTSIAAEVGRKLSAKGVDVWWVSAVDHARLVAGMHAVGRLIGASAEELQADDAADAVWRRLNAQTQPWLLVVDNADDPEVFDVTADGAGWADGWIRPVLNQTGLVLVTSRRGGGRTHAGRRLRQIPVDMLNPADGAQVLLDLTHGRGGDHKAACALSERLGGLPLALAVAGSYLAQSVDDLWVDDDAVITFQDFHAALDLGRTDLMDTPPQDPAGGAGPAIDEVWRMAVHLLEKRGLSLAGRFIRLLAHFAPAPLPYRDILRQRALFDSPVFAGLDREQAGSLLHESANLGLLTLTAADALDPADVAVPVLRLHPLRRDAGHRYLDPVHGDDDYLTTAARLLVDSAAGEADWSPKDHTRWNFWTLLAPHAFHLLPALARTDIDPTLVDRVAHTVDLAARHLYVRGLRAQAEAEYQSMLRTCRHALGDEHERTLAARHGIALVFEGRGDLAGAEAELQAVLDIARRVLGEEHPSTLTTQHNLAIVCAVAGRYRESDTTMRAVLAARQRVLGENHPTTQATKEALKNIRHNAAKAKQPILWHGPGKRRKKGKKR
ncbi:tetratricopeptide repeat protein [Amycolatopsis sp. cmx-4-54]|uniref:tetratricopeptide repeat protein n=1 Tax=Amycolatopsis sp. cmx-4-54 TaxID=2790936 RepID=UPI00397BCC5F